MTLTLADRVQFSSATTGTGTITAGAAQAAFRALSSIADGETTSYVAVDNSTAGAFECGHGVVGDSGTTLTRGPLVTSAPGNAAIFLSGDVTVFIDALYEDIVLRENNLADLADFRAARAAMLGSYVHARTGTVALTSADSGTVQSDGGASALTTLDLPAWASGLVFPILCETVHGIHIVAAGTDTINNGGGEVSSAGGSLTSGTDSSGTDTAAGFAATLTAGSVSGKWYVTSALGLWTTA